MFLPILFILRLVFLYTLLQFRMFIHMLQGMENDEQVDSENYSN